MASTYGNDLRLEEIGDGEQSGTWGATTNTNLELIAEALSFGTEAITTNADTHTTTIADGATDPGRSLYLKYTGTLDSTCTITIAPNSISKTWYIENGTSGSQSIIISQGSGANVTILTGQTKIVYSDGAGSSAAMAEIGTLGVTNLAVTTNATVGGTLGVTGVLTGTSLDISGNVDIDGTTNLDAVDIDGAVQLDATLTVGANDQGYDVILYGDTAARNATWDSSADSLIFTDNTKAVFGTGSDATILFDGTDMKVGATAGHLDLFTSEVGSSVRILGSGESLAEFTDDGDVDLFHNGTLKMSTTATGISVAGSVVDNLTRGSIKVGNSSGVFAPLAKGAAGTVLTSDGTDLSFAAVASGGAEPVVWFNVASPNNTYTSSGTWSKGGLADDAYVWFYLVGGGGGGGKDTGNPSGYGFGGEGGGALLVYGTAGILNGAAYVIGAGSAASADYQQRAGTVSTLTLSSAQGSRVFTTSKTYNGGEAFKFAPPVTNTTTLNATAPVTASLTTDNVFAVPSTVPTSWGGTYNSASDNSWTGGAYMQGPKPGGNGIFGGGGGGGKHAGTLYATPGGSLYSGAGGAGGSSPANGTAPGGGGGGNSGNSAGGAGAAGNVRVYHV